MTQREDDEREGLLPAAGLGVPDPTSNSLTQKLVERQELYNGFGNGLALAFELALVPTIFGLMGYGLDRWLGTLPIFLLVFVLVAVVGLSVRQWYSYDLRMKIHEAAGPWARAETPRNVSPAPPTAPTADADGERVDQ